MPPGSRGRTHLAIVVVRLGVDLLHAQSAPLDFFDELRYLLVYPLVHLQAVADGRLSACHDRDVAVEVDETREAGISCILHSNQRWPDGGTEVG